MTSSIVHQPASRSVPSGPSPESLERLHNEAEGLIQPFNYHKPSGIGTAKGRVDLGRTDCIHGVVQVVKRDGGENNLHYHTNIDSLWMVLKGRAKFYGPDDEVIGEFGPQEGTIMPAYARYWFENVGESDLELLQVVAFHDRDRKDSGRTDLAPQRFAVGSSERYEAAKG
ncbi:MAG TPA: cupin domain-containing protein [Alphaproteobacteria bacterium]|jgi:mannose-6-phosphate isomerase-like protein (cupin superfamily)